MPARRPVPRRSKPALHSEDHRTRLVNSLLLIVGVLMAGTMGYMLIEHWPWMDALYMTVITVGTVGYGETHHLSATGRVFTMMLIVGSIVLIGYSVSTLAAFVIEGEFNRLVEGRRMDKRLAGLRDHIILCGLGQTGKWIAEELRKTGTPFVAIERSPEPIRDIAQNPENHYLQGDATEDDTLLEAGIQRAKGLITVLSQDKDNVFVVLTARSLNPSLRIVARLIEEANAAKLRKAGADEVVSPNAVGGMRMASVMIRPAVVTFLDTMLRMTGPTLRLEEVRVTPGSALAGKTLVQADIGRRTGLLVVAIQPREGGYNFNPGGQVMLREGDVLIILGTREQLDVLEPLNRV